MCAIAGLLYRDSTGVCRGATLDAMRDLVRYRGPDDAGNYVDGEVGVAHRRLSIIDLSGGHQPMTDARGRYRIVFNGEIYNYRELRSSLIAKGFAFQTHSDTEVILNLYADVGPRCVEQMNGMFAFAIWDSEERSLFLARDRMGVKPLYYAEPKGAFVFGSEIKSLFASGELRPECRYSALTEYMLFRQVAGPETLFRGVHSLPPGCVMTVRNGSTKISRYWSPLPAADRKPCSYDDARSELQGLLEDSVRLRLISDVPLGTFCSGGVDSSLVTALAAKIKGEGVNTYSIGFDEPGFDESDHALAVSRHCRTNHHQLRVGNEEFDRLLPTMVWHNDEPLDFANSVHIFALSRLAKQSVTVVLTGEGSDELFAGYPRYRLPDLAHSVRMLPSSALRLAAAVSGDRRFTKLHRAVASSRDCRLLHNSAYLSADSISTLGPELAPADLSFRLDRLEASAGLGLDNVGRLTLLDQETFLVSILHRQDKMSMAASIESRVPFMDYRVVEFANRLPTAHKLKRGRGKSLVKDVARTFLPAEIVDRRKSGFGVPLDHWFRANSGLGSRVRELPSHPKADLFDRRVLETLVDEHRTERHDHSETLWTILNVCLWRESFGV